MKIASIDFPDAVLAALRDGNLVIFAGAGVSRGEPACLPDFADLARKIAEATGESFDKKESPERFLGRLEHSGVKVHERAEDMLAQYDSRPTDMHVDLLRLSPNARSVRIVTTNFDRLFEQAAKDVLESIPTVYQAPALPLGRDFNGIVHVHGAVGHARAMVLTEADFGRAYLTEGWARRFLVEAFRSFSVLFVGYSHEDVIMNYLSRALPGSDTKPRFALTDESGADKWRQLGIQTVVYLKESERDYSSLHKGIHCLASHIQRSILDWQREINSMARAGPSLDEEGIALMEEALSDPAKLRFFANAASTPDWIDWLYERGHLDSLVGAKELSECDRVLGGWLAQNFACQHADELFLLVSRQGMRLHREFWFELGRVVGLESNPSLSNEDLSRWTSLLIATAPSYIESASLIERVLSWLRKRCAERQLVGSLIDIFDVMATSYLTLRPGFPWPIDEADGRRTGLDVEVLAVCDHYSINELWIKGLQPQLNSVAEPLLECVVRHFKARHRMLCVWSKADEEWDPDSFHRRAVEPHPQDKYPKHIDVLIDAARDCLEQLISQKPKTAANWCSHLVHAQVPLLRRLAVDALMKRIDLQLNEKVDWLLAHVKLHDRALRHELFQSLRLLYPEASQKRRKSVIKTVLAFRWPNEESERKEQYTARHHFDWLHWLHEAAPECELAERALRQVWKEYPDWRPREHPDLLFSGGVMKEVRPRSPWSVEELLSKPLTEEWVRELVAFQQREFLGADREGLSYAVMETAIQQTSWGLDLANMLASMEIWETDLWDALSNAWRTAELEDAQYRRIFELFANDGLQQYQAWQIAKYLRVWVSNTKARHSRRMLVRTNDIATSSWGRIDQDLPSEGTNDWANRAINHPAGALAEYWIVSLSLWRQQQEPRPKKIAGQYRKLLTLIAREKTVAGRLGRCLLAEQLSFFLAVDETWTKNNLLPWFMNFSSMEDYQAVWDGFLHAPLINPHVAALMNDPFLEAVERLGTHFASEGSDNRRRSERLIGAYIVMLAYYASDPVNTWIPKLLKSGDEADRQYFATEVRRHLIGMEDDDTHKWWQRWLRTYWQNRLRGVPIPLVADEVEVMLEWLPHLGRAFSDAVTLAIKMPKPQLQHTSVVYYIAASELPREHPKAVAELLLYLEGCELPIYAWRDGKEFIENLLEGELPQSLKTDLQELVVRAGLK